MAKPRRTWHELRREAELDLVARVLADPDSDETLVAAATAAGSADDQLPIGPGALDGCPKELVWRLGTALREFQRWRAGPR